MNGPTNVFKEIEEALQCCGVESYVNYDSLEGWKTAGDTTSKAPSTCCLVAGENCNKSTTASSYKPGCGPLVVELLRKYMHVVIGIGCSVLAIEVICIICAIKIGNVIRKKPQN